MTVEAVQLLEIDRTYGGVYAGTSFEFSERIANHFNAAAAAGGELLPGEFTPFSPGLVFSIACPILPVPREQFIAAHRQFRAVIDGERELRLTEFPHIFGDDPKREEHDGSRDREGLHEGRRIRALTHSASFR